MRAEAQSNLPLIRDSVARLKVQATYIRSLEDALLAGKRSGDSVDVHGVSPNAGSALYVSPSRATWSAAQAAGLAALFPLTKPSSLPGSTTTPQRRSARTKTCTKRYAP